MSVTTGHRSVNVPFGQNLDRYGYQYSNGPRSVASHHPNMSYLPGADQRPAHLPLPRPQAAFSDTAPQAPTSWRGAGSQYYVTNNIHPDRVQRDHPLHAETDPVAVARLDLPRLPQQRMPSYPYHNKDIPLNSGGRKFNEVCLNFERGRCLQGNACQRIHLSLPRSTQASIPQISPQEDMWRGSAGHAQNLSASGNHAEAHISRGVCVEYRRTGVCGRYADCQDVHIPPGQAIPVCKDEPGRGLLQSSHSPQHGTKGPVASMPFAHPNSSYSAQPVVIAAPAVPLQHQNVKPSLHQQSSEFPQSNPPYDSRMPHASPRTPLVAAPVSSHEHAPTPHTSPESRKSPETLAHLQPEGPSPNHTTLLTQQQALLAIFQTKDMSQQTILQSVAPMIKLRNPRAQRPDPFPKQSGGSVKLNLSPGSPRLPSETTASTGFMTTDATTPPTIYVLPENVQSHHAEHLSLGIDSTKPVVKIPLPQFTSPDHAPGYISRATSATPIDAEAVIETVPVLEEVKIPPTASAQHDGSPLFVSAIQDKPSSAVAELKPRPESRKSTPVAKKELTTSNTPGKSEKAVSPAKIVTKAKGKSQTNVTPPTTQDATKAKGHNDEPAARPVPLSVISTPQSASAVVSPAASEQVTGAPIRPLTRVVCRNFLHGKCHVASCPRQHPMEARPSSKKNEVKADDTAKLLQKRSTATPDAVAKQKSKRRTKHLGKTKSQESVSSESSVTTRSSSPEKTESPVAVKSRKAGVAPKLSSGDASVISKASSSLQPVLAPGNASSKKLMSPTSGSVNTMSTQPNPGKYSSASLETTTETQRQRRKHSPSHIDRLSAKLQMSAAKVESVDDGKAASLESKNTPLLPPGLNLERTSFPSLSQHPSRQMTLTVYDATRVTFGAGFVVHDLMTGFETRDIVLKGVPLEVTVDDIQKVLQPFGEVTSVHLPDHNRDGVMTVKASFATHMAAAAAVSSLDRTDILGGSVDILLASTSPGKATVHDGDVCVEFPSPSRFAFAGYANRAMAETAIAMAAESAMFGEIHEGLPNLGPVNVRFQGLDPKAQPTEIEKLGKCEGVMLGSYNYQRLEPALEQLYDKLESFGDLDSLDVLPPPYTRGIVRAWARFRNPKTAERVCSELNFRPLKFIGNTKLSAHHQRTLLYTLPGNIFDVLSFDIRYLRYCANTDDNRCNVVIVDKRGFSNTSFVQIKLLAENPVVLGRLKTSFERLLKGTEVKREGAIIWDPYFVTSAGFSFLNNLQRVYRGIVISKNLRRRVLSLFGPPGRIEAVRSAILEKVGELRRRPYKTFALKGQLVGLFMSSDLAKLQQELGADNVELDLSAKTLRVHGNEDAFKVARLAIHSAQHRQSGQKKSVENACPVCLDKVTSPVSLECGHTWCKACISEYLNASVDTKVFPITCLGDEARCEHRITLDTVQEILSPSQVESIVQASFISYIHAHTSEFHHCPTPDCPQIYRNAPKGTILRCPSCLIRICTDCDKEQHAGTCRYSESEDMKMFQEWTKDHDVKKCPGCKAPIERSAGCNHMTCVQCKTHICWVCLARFPNGDEVYDHMHETHGGIGL